VGKSDGPWAKVECCSRPRAFLEVALKVEVCIVKLAEFDDVVCKELRGEDIKGSCRRGCEWVKSMIFADPHLLDADPASCWMGTLASSEARTKALIVLLSRLPAT